jgi:hypothetical protein
MGTSNDSLRKKSRARLNVDYLNHFGILSSDILIDKHPYLYWVPESLMTANPPCPIYCSYAAADLFLE